MGLTTRTLCEGPALKILHVWDQAGTACLMALHQRKLGHKADIIMREEFDSHCYFYGFLNKTNPVSHSSSDLRKIYLKMPHAIRKTVKLFRQKMQSAQFYYLVWKKGKDYDVLHIHSVYQCLLLHPFKPKLIEFHGDDVRDMPSLHSHFDHALAKLFIRVYSLLGNQLFISTPDLKREIPDAVWIPNPVDTEFFSPDKKRTLKNCALYTHNWYETGRHAIEISEREGWTLRFFDRASPANEWIPYEYFPDFLSQFEYFIDRKAIPSLSKTALEALAMGIKVVRWDGKVISELDDRHKPDHVAALAVKLYEDRLR